MNNTDSQQTKQIGKKMTALLVAGALAGGLAGYGISRTARPRPAEQPSAAAETVPETRQENVTEPTCKPLVLEYPEVTDVTMPPLVKQTVLPEGTDLERESWQLCYSAILEAATELDSSAVVPEERNTYEPLGWMKQDMDGDERPELILSGTAYNENENGGKGDWIRRMAVFYCRKTEHGYTAVQAEKLIDGIECYATGTGVGLYKNPQLDPNGNFDLMLYTLKDGQLQRTYHAPFDFRHGGEEFEVFLETHPHMGYQKLTKQSSDTGLQ